MVDDKDTRIAALEAQLADKVKVKSLEWVEIAEGPRCITPCGTYAIHPSAGAYGRPTLSLTGMPGDLFGKFDTIEAAKAAAQADFGRRILSALEVIPTTPKVTEAGPVPTYECEFRVGQPVRLANPYAEDDPDRTFYVTGIDWEYRSVVGHGWNITVATAEEIARGYGATDGFTPSDLTAAQEAGKS